jgi:hypothetical protein
MRKILLLFILVVAQFSAVLAMGYAPPNAAALGNRISQELSQMDDELAHAAAELTNSDLRGTAASHLLSDLYHKHYSIVDVATIDLNGKLLLIEPFQYKEAEGKNISDQPHFGLLQQTGNPLLSNMFKTVEGFYAVALAYPIVSPQGKTIGYISIVLQPDALARKIIEPALANFSGYEALILQTDGRILYDRDILQVGKLTFSDPLYQSSPSLLSLAKQIIKDAKGNGTYSFINGQQNNSIKKDATWVTISLHNTAWRLILSKISDK